MIEAIRSLNERLGIPKKLDAVGVTDIPQMAKRAEREASPVPRLVTQKKLEGLYHQIAEGRKQI